jgi:hypothetical protein
MIIARILGWILIAAALIVAAAGIALWIDGQNFALVAGQLWYQIDSDSLNETQLVIQRYLHPVLWDHLLLPLLQKPAYQAVPLAFLVPFALGLALVIGFRRRERRRRFN